MERFSTMTLRRCYKATVNESETITEAQRLCRVRHRSGTGGFRGLNFKGLNFKRLDFKGLDFRILGSGLPVSPQIERS
jgi:hypothetical protein